MSSWSAAKYEFCVNGVSKLEDHTVISVDDRHPLPGIERNSSTMGKKFIGYSVEKPMGAGGKMFVGVVVVPNGWIPGDIFRALETLFGSQNEIIGMLNDKNISAFKDRTQPKYKDCQIVPGCKEKLFDSTDIKWWALEEVKQVMKEMSLKNSVNNSTGQVMIVKNAIPAVKSSSAEALVVETTPSDDKNGDENVEGEVDENLKANVTKLKSEDSIIYEPVKKNVEKAIQEKEEEVLRMKRKVTQKDEKITQLTEELKEVNKDIQEEVEKAKKVMGEKNDNIKHLTKEIEDLENQIKDLKKINGDLNNEKLDWNQNFEEEDIRKEFQETLEKNKTETEKIIKEKEALEYKVHQIEKVAKEKTNTIVEVQKQLKDISDNCSYLQSELVKQKAQLSDELNVERTKKSELLKKLEDSKKELNEKQEEINNLKEKVAELQASSGQKTGEELQAPSDGQKLDEILSLLKEKNAVQEIEQPRRGQYSAYNSTNNIQVSRIRSKNVKVLLVGHPEVFRNMENTPTLKRNILDLIKTDNIEILTGDFEGFQLKNLLPKATDLLKKPSFSEVVQDVESSKKEITTVFIFPGNHYEAKAYLEENKGKSPYMLETKMESSVGSLKTNIVEILDAAIGKEKELVVVFDPASEQTYKYSRHMLQLFNNSLEDWKASLPEEDRPRTLVWDMTKEQIEAGRVQTDKRKCWEIVDGVRNIFLHRGALTTDEARVSKKMTINIFNKIADHIAGSPAGAPICKECGIQQSSSYIDKCVDMDMGDYKGCAACSKDTHDVNACWARKFESERLCRVKKCSQKGLKHSSFVHDLTNPKYQEEARQKLGHEIDFWPRPRMQRPFFTHKEGPPHKRRKEDF